MSLADGRTVGHRADEPVPMASTVKLPLAIALLRRAAADACALDAVVELRPAHFRPGHGVLTRTAAAGHAPPPLDLRALIRLSMTESDNTATDRLFEAVGGPAAVQRELETVGIVGVRVDRTMLALLSDRRGVDAIDGADFDVAAWEEARAAVPQNVAEAARARMITDSRDTATPRALVDLLVAVHARRALPEPYATELLDVMRNCRTGRGRIRATAPRGAVVSSKSGTIEGVVVADVALVATTGGVTLAVAAFLVDAAIAQAEQEALLADAASIAVSALTSA